MSVRFSIVILPGEKSKTPGAKGETLQLSGKQEFCVNPERGDAGSHKRGQTGGIVETQSISLEKKRSVEDRLQTRGRDRHTQNYLGGII